MRAKFLGAGALAIFMMAANLALITSPFATVPAGADTSPVPTTLPETVSAAALPTVQINGVVWNQVIVGDRVYATGQFTQARPAGAAPGTNQTPRSHILAYNLTTGALITSWAPTLNAQGMEIAASADGSVIYVGGDFTQVNLQSRNRIAAIDAQSGALLPFNPGANSRVDALAVNGNTVYFGGNFTTAGTSATGGVMGRTRLAAANATTSAILPWAPTADRAVHSMVYHPGTGRVVVGGMFDNLNSSQQWGMGSLDGGTGALRPWAANTVIQNHGANASIASLTTDGEKIFGIGWAYFGGGATANFEGAFAADPATGAIDWVDGGRGDTYDIAVAGDVVYTAGHPHDWGMLDWNPQYNPYQFQYALAIDKHRSPTLTNAFGTSSIWLFDGMPAAQPLHWLPTFSLGNYTGQYQAPWSVESNGDYAVFGGEFPRVNGINQQGLVRFAKRTIAPSVDPIQGFPQLAPTVTPLGPGTVRLGWTGAWDRDNQRLTVEVLRGGSVASSVVRTSFQTDTNWWNRPPLGFVDSAPPGSSQTYRIRVTDAFNNTLVGPAVTATIPAGTPPTASSYAASVLADKPAWHWRMSEAGGTTAYDRAGSNDLTLNAANVRNVAGALLTQPDPATEFPGTTSTGTVQGATSYWQSGPQTFSLEAWVRTSTTTGGKIVGFGDSRGGRSGSNGTDRHLYMNNAGQIYFGVRPDMGTRVTINSPATYRDDQWHHVVGTLGSDGMKLYVDGNQVASNANVKKAQVYRGYWRVGGDRLSLWPSTPATEAITATLDEIAVYPTALPADRVQQHYVASGRSGNFPNTPPFASFTATTEFLTASFDANGSSDSDGSIVSYAWNFGDGSDPGSGVEPDHEYAVADTYTVTLTVTDNRGGTNTTTRDVTVTDPPPNVPPTASFTSSSEFLTASFDASGSREVGGSIVSYAWNFGDGSDPGSGVAPEHEYAVADTYTVTLTVTDDDGETDTASGSVTVTDPPPGFAFDAFDRTVTNGWGTADVGGPWTLSGTVSAFSVANGTGRITGGPSLNRAMYLNGVQQSNVDFTTDIALDTPASGGGAYVSAIGRRVSNGNDYRLKLRYVAGGTVAAYLVRTVGGAETTIATANTTGVTVSPGNVLRVRFEVSGSPSATLRAKVWRATDSEPQNWLLTATDSTAALQSPGGVGVLVYVSSSWAGTPPVLAFDNLGVVAP
ncbi:MAG: PKD domain-containing protein [Acidimicrobiia bacterium]